jgi:hypothetical protein
MIIKNLVVTSEKTRCISIREINLLIAFILLLFLFNELDEMEIFYQAKIYRKIRNYVVIYENDIYFMTVQGCFYCWKYEW